MNSLLTLVICVLINEITTKPLEINATCFCIEPLSNITDLSKKNYKLDTNKQLKYAGSEKELKIESEERKIDSDSNERSNNDNTELTPAIEDESKKCNTDDCETSTGLHLNEADYKYTINTDDHSNVDKDINIRALKNRSAKTNVRELRSELLNHLLEYFLNIIKEEKHSESRKKYNKEEIKLEDKLRNYYHSDLDQLFHEGNLDMDQKDTEYPFKEWHISSNGLFQAVDDGTEYSNRKRQTEGELTLVDKQTEDSDMKHLDFTENIHPIELEETKLELNAPNKIIQDSNENNGLTIEESVDKNPTVRIEDNLTISDLVNNKENKFLNIAKIEVATEHTNQTQNTTGMNYINKKENAKSSEDYKQNIGSHIDKNNSENSMETNNEHTNTWMRQFFFGFNKDGNLEDGYKKSSGCDKHNYIIQLNIQI